MDFSNTQVMNFKGSFRGMRNPLNSWTKSDSFFGIVEGTDNNFPDFEISVKWMKYRHPELKEEDIDFSVGEVCDIDDWLLLNGVLQYDEVTQIGEVAFLGPKDLELAQKLIKAGPEHRKFLRQIFVSVDIDAPRYWWGQFATYSVGVTANSTSTMHKLASTPITFDCFETDDLQNITVREGEQCTQGVDINYMSEVLIEWLEELRQQYNKTGDKNYWKELIRWLPQSYKQTRTVTMNYENILSICKQRKGHKLTEWEKFITWAESLPYAKELIFISDGNTKITD